MLHDFAPYRQPQKSTLEENSNRLAHPLTSNIDPSSERLTKIGFTSHGFAPFFPALKTAGKGYLKN
jgi:hypothetical protein